jgi:hypothetical protein
MGRSSRRQFLQTTACCAFVGTLAGCPSDSSIPGIDAAYAEWLPAPETLAYTDRYTVRSFDPVTIDERASLLSDAVVQRLRQHSDGGRQHLGISRDTVDAVYHLDTFGTVLAGSFDLSTVTDGLRAEGWQSTGSDGEFDIFTRPQTAVTAAASPDGIVLTPEAPGNGNSFVGPILDAYRDDRTHYTDADDTIGPLAEALGDGDIVVLNDGEGVRTMADVQAVGSAWRLTEDTAKTTLGLAFPDSSAVDTGAIDSLTDSDAFSAYEGISVAQRGRVGIVTATTTTVTPEAVAPLPSLSTCLTPGPTATFDFTTSGDDRLVTITHDGGDPVPVSRLSIRGEGFAERVGAAQSTPGQWRGETSADASVVTAGDQVTIGVSEDPLLRVEYRPLTDGSPVVLGDGP